jgi:hypothetical protein
MKTSRYCCRCCRTTVQTEGQAERVCDRCGAVTFTAPQRLTGEAKPLTGGMWRLTVPRL